MLAVIPRQPLLDRSLPSNVKNLFPESLPAILGHCEAVGLNLTSKHLRKMIAIPERDYTYNKTLTMLERLQELFEEELPAVQFVHVPASKVKLYQQPHHFGPIVAVKFPSASDDIKEAGKCFALELNTACVMHLMRSLEVALAAIGLGVGIPSTIIEAKNSWEALLRKINKQIEDNNKSGDLIWLQKRQFYVDAQAHLFAVKNAWRNPSMHLEKKYSGREAARIFRAVQDFMEHLATHLNESGEFTA